MPNELEQYFVQPPAISQGAIDLTLTNTVTHPPDPTWQIDCTLLVYEGLAVSDPEIEVSLTHA